MFDAGPKTISDGRIDPGCVARQEEHDKDQNKQKYKVQTLGRGKHGGLILGKVLEIDWSFTHTNR